MTEKYDVIIVGASFAGLAVVSKIKGEVLSDNEFVYELKEGQTAEILSGSVKTDSKKLSDNKIDLNIFKISSITLLVLSLILVV